MGDSLSSVCPNQLWSGSLRSAMVAKCEGWLRVSNRKSWNRRPLEEGVTQMKEWRINGYENLKVYCKICMRLPVESWGLVGSRGSFQSSK